MRRSIGGSHPLESCAVSVAKPRALELGLAVLAAASGLWRVVELRQLGFPDGHLTELETAMRPPHLALAALTVWLGLGLLLSSRGRLWCFSVVVAVLVDRLALDGLGLLLGLEDGQGG